MVGRSISDQELAIIAQYAELGKSDEEIADILGWSKTMAAAPRAVAKQRRKLNLKKRGAESTPKTDLTNLAKNKLLEVMTRQERFDFIKARIASNPRNVMVFEALSKQEEAFFLSEYYNILQSTESITEAEEQQLFAAVIEYVLAFRALRMKTAEERCVEETLAGTIPDTSPRYKLKVDPRHEESYSTHMQTYQNLMNGLKMSRKQRLDKVKSDRRTLVDVASELSTQNAQALAADEIERMSILSDEELKRLLDAGYVMGLFENK
jgi:hypothetical protein